MRHQVLFLLQVIIFLMVSLAFGSTIGVSNPYDSSTEGAFIKVNPQLRFQVDSKMRKNVDFWIRIYTEFSTNKGLIHDSKYIDHVYEILQLRDESKQNGKLIKASKKKWKEVLLSVHKKQEHVERMTEDEKRVFELFRDVNEPNKFLNAAHRKRLRFQLGQRDRFLDGLYQSGRFLPLMEEIFRKEGMPLELTRLPFVESSFNFRARSKVGASGIWQFMRSTAKLFIKLNPALDERNDPIRSTEAAARLLRDNFESLGSWPLAVTAYNHGRKGMMRAVRKVGSDELGDVVTEYHSRSFGFASGNFFTELLAAIEVEKNAEKYFGKIEKAVPITYAELELPDFIELKSLTQHLSLDPKTIKELNPGLTEAVYSGALLVPRGYKLRLPSLPGIKPESQEAEFQLAYAKIPAKYKLPAQNASNYGKSAGLVKKAKKGKKNSSW